MIGGLSGRLALGAGALALLVAGCGSAGSSTAPPAGLRAASCVRAAPGRPGSTVSLAVGEDLCLAHFRPGTAASDSQPGVLAPLAAGRTGRYRAARPGDAILFVTRRPDCRPGTVCSMIIVVLGRVLVQVHS